MEGELETIMAGLNCGTPSEHGWRILKGSSDAFLSCDDRITVIGMRKLYYPSGNQTHNYYSRYFTRIIFNIVTRTIPMIFRVLVLGTDERIISGESGAVCVGALSEICKNEKYAHVKKELGLSKTSSILIISTEGDTDKEGFDAIVANCQP